MGFTREQSLKALKDNNWNLEKAQEELEGDSEIILDNLTAVLLSYLGSSSTFS
jgi:hypothetical protein